MEFSTRERIEHDEFKGWMYDGKHILDLFVSVLYMKYGIRLND